MELYLSDKPSKRFVIVFGDKKYYFGSPTGFTYIDGATDKQRDNYRKRHLNNPLEHDLITNLVPSPALFSFFISWGDSRDPIKNLKKLNALMKHK
jgi:hypothetical protein